jgi:hypothetical protein
MSTQTFAETLKQWRLPHDAAAALLAEPWLPLAAGAVVVLLIGLLAVRALRRRTPRPRLQALNKQVHALADLGAASSEIARRTGLPRDAVEMMLHVAPARETRQNSPRTAASAAARATSRPAAKEGNVSQVYGRYSLGVFEPKSAGPAQALPLTYSSGARNTTEAA